MLATAVAGVMRMIDVVGGTLAWTCSLNCFTVPVEISVTLRGVLGAGGKRPILDAKGSSSKRRRHIQNYGTLVLENLNFTRGYYGVRSGVCFSVTVGSVSACACACVWRGIRLEWVAGEGGVATSPPAVLVCGWRGKCTATMYGHSTLTLFFKYTVHRVSSPPSRMWWWSSLVWASQRCHYTHPFFHIWCAVPYISSCCTLSSVR